MTQPAPQTPIQRLLEHQKQDEHTWQFRDIERRTTICSVCGIAQLDWEQMRQARAQLVDLELLDMALRQVEPVAPVPTDAMTTLERQQQQEIELLKAAVAHYENGITWQTTCLNCAETIDKTVAVHLAVLEERDQMRAVVDAAREIGRRYKYSAQRQPPFRKLIDALAALDAQEVRR